MSMSLPRALALCLSLSGLAALSLAQPVLAETAGQTLAESGDAAVGRLIDTMKIDDVIEVLRVEGVDYGNSIEDQMFPGSGGASWQSTVASIYDAESMKAAFAERLTAELQGQAEATGKMADFFASALGQRVLALELEGRRAMLDEDSKAAAELAWGDLSAEGGARVDLLRRFVEVNNLVDANVLGALNANLAFYKGMAGTGAFDGEMTEDQLLSDVWGQEPDIRQQTEDWVYPYLALSYSSLSDAELQAYLDFSSSADGRRLNDALFAAFDAVFVPISRALGAAAALQIKGQDI